MLFANKHSHRTEASRKEGAIPMTMNCKSKLLGTMQLYLMLACIYILEMVGRKTAPQRRVLLHSLCKDVVGLIHL